MTNQNDAIKEPLTQIGIMVKPKKESSECEICTSMGDTYKVYHDSKYAFTMIVLFNPENPQQHKFFKFTEDDWLEVFEDWEYNTFIENVKSLPFVQGIVRTNSMFDISLFGIALSRKYTQLNTRAKEKLLDDIWELSSYASKARQKEIASVLNSYNSKYIPTSEKTIISDAVAFCQDIAQRMNNSQVDKIARDIDKNNIFTKFIAFNTIVKYTNGVNLNTDNKLIKLIAWKNGLSNSFDFSTLQSFFYCFDLISRWRILQKLAYEKEYCNLQITTDHLIFLVESNPKVKAIRRSFDGLTSVDYIPEILVYGLDAYVKTGKFLNQSKVLEIFNRINDRHAKIELSLHVLFDFCNGGLLRDYKYNKDSHKSYLFDRYEFFKTIRFINLSDPKYDCLNNICNGRLSTQKDEKMNVFFLWCNGNPCFRSVMKKQTDYKSYQFIDFCTAFGRQPYIETDSGLAPNDELSKFIDTLSKVSRITSHLYCESCKQLLFPDKRSSKEFVSAYNTFCCQNPHCDKQGISVYISHCHTSNCRGVVDSRHHKKCPNGMHICPECFGCCSEKFYRRQEALHEAIGRNIIPPNDSGHNDKGIFYCHKCGNQLIDNKCSNCGIEHSNIKRYKYGIPKTSEE